MVIPHVAAEHRLLNVFRYRGGEGAAACRPIDEDLPLATRQPQQGAVLDVRGDELAALLLDERIEELARGLLCVFLKRFLREAARQKNSSASRALFAQNPRRTASTYSVFRRSSSRRSRSVIASRFGSCTSLTVALPLVLDVKALDLVQEPVVPQWSGACQLSQPRDRLIRGIPKAGAKRQREF